MRKYFDIVLIVYLVVFLQICEARKNRKRHGVKAQRKMDFSDKLDSISLQDLIKKICLPAQFNRLVYRYQNSSQIFIGFDDLEKDIVYTMTWKMTKFNQEALSGDNKNKFTERPAAEIRKQMKYYNLLAAADKKIQDKFQSNISSCVQSKITSKACVIQSLAVLARKMKEVTIEKKCNS